MRLLEATCVAVVITLVLQASGSARAAGPGDVTLPVYEIFPGDSIQDAVNRSPSGTIFLIKAGVHRRQVIRPKDDTAFIGEPGAILDGENVAPQAFDGYRTKNVRVRGLRITRYAPPESNGAIQGLGSEGWVVEGNEVDNNSNGDKRAYGISVGNRWVVRANRVHHNGWLGIHCYNSVDTLIEGNDVYSNPPARINDTIGEAANMKLFGCGRITIRENLVHDGPLRGIWLDTSQPDMTIEGNRIENHGEAGIWYEVSYRGIIRNNYVSNAGYNSYYSSGWLRAGGITVTNSPDVTVTGNTVVNSLNGIIGLQAGSYKDGPYGRNELRNLLVQGNTIVMPKGQSGVAENIGTNAVYVSWNNRFINNRYQLFRNERPFSWMGLNLDEGQWQAHGQDKDSPSDSFVR